MPRVVIMNQGTEHTRGYDAKRSGPLNKSVRRSLWLVDAGDIIISPVPIEPEFVKYVGDTLGFDTDSLTILVQDHLRAEGLLISEADVERLRGLIGPGDGWTVMPCFWTPDVAELAASLGLGDAAAIAFAAQRGPDLFNRKQNFRQFAAGAAIPIPEGSPVVTKAELVDAIERHLPRTGTVIVKKNNSAGGIGNLAFTTTSVKAFPGARETSHVGDVEALAASAWEQLTDERGQALVVEVYHDAPQNFYFEYFIGDDGRPVFLHSGDVRLRARGDADSTELVWLGLDTPTELSHFSLAEALAHSERFAMLAASVGCRGHINIDAMLTTDGELMFNESNVRWGGGSPLHTIGSRLLGRRFADDHAISFVRDVVSPSRLDAERILTERGLWFSPETKEGALILTCHEVDAGTMDCVLIGASRARVRELEAAVRESLA